MSHARAGTMPGRAVAAGLGVAFLSRISVADELACERVRVWAVAGLDLHRPWYLLRRSAARPSPAAVALLSFLKAYVAGSEHLRVARPAAPLLAQPGQ